MITTCADPTLKGSQAVWATFAKRVGTAADEVGLPQSFAEEVQPLTVVAEARRGSLQTDTGQTSSTTGPCATAGHA